MLVVGWTPILHGLILVVAAVLYTIEQCQILPCAKIILILVCVCVCVCVCVLYVHQCVYVYLYNINVIDILFIV